MTKPALYHDPIRRQFLKASGWTAGGVTILFSSGCSLPVLPSMRDKAQSDADSWLQALPDNRIRFYIGKAEMGQGVVTGLSQIVADTLDIPIDRIDWILGNTQQVPRMRMTVGSESIRTLYGPLRAAAQQLAADIQHHTAKRLHVSESGLKLKNGGFIVLDTGDWIGFGDALTDKSPSTMTTVEPGNHRYIGASVPRLDIPSKVTGKAEYAHDIHLPGMLFGKIARPPALGARLKHVNAEKARTMQGVVSIVKTPDNDFVGIVAESEIMATNALGALELEWEIPHRWEQDEIEALLDPARLEQEEECSHHVLTEGDLDQGRTETSKQIDLSFATPFAAHATMETPAAVADVGPNHAQLWVSSQDAPFHRDLTAKITGLSTRQIVVHPTLVGGGFGGKVYVAAAIEAVRLSAAVHRPVRVIWTREETFRHSHLRSATRHRIRAGINASGNVSYWQHDFSSGPVIFSPAFLPPPAQWLTSFMIDKGITRGAYPPYAFGCRHVRFWQPELPVTTGPWRGLNSSLNCFVIESAIDELAQIANTDPIQFRLQHTGSDQHRLRRVIETVAAQSGWGNHPASGDSALGFACGIYLDTSFVAIVAEVTLKPETREILVTRLFCAHDCGLLINPDAVRSQVEGNLIWGCSSALKEALIVKNGQLDAANFDAYPILRMHETPRIDIRLIEDRDIPPSGAGEPALMPVSAAIANAIRAASGRRITSLPIRPDAVFS